MFTEPVSTETVYQISDEEQRHILQKNFDQFYHILCENRLIPNAACETVHGVRRFLSGIPVPYQNVVFGCPESGDKDACVEAQLNYFHEEKMPFIWYLDEDSHPEFKQKLLERGFQDLGVFRGVIGILDQPILAPEIPSDCVLELVADETAMDEFNELVCATFEITGSSKDLYRTVLWNGAQAPELTMFHWIARKQGKLVSALTTFVNGDVVSFWNGASIPEVRKQGLNTALRRKALQDAVSRGCRYGSSYLMAEGLAFGICAKLGYETKWRFNAFLAPGSAGGHE